ncbi:MAG: glycosyltransferase family 2 protein [Fusicatenibacter sp.]
MTKPQISVIIPVYNVEMYLARCIDSVLGQDCTDLEVILVDDGSTDSSGAICDTYARRDGRIRVIHQKNMGLFGARNTGLTAACGEYISFIDSDDWIEPDTYAAMEAIIKQHHPDMIRFGFQKMLHGKVISERTMPYAEGVYREGKLWQIKLDTISNEGILDYKKTRILSACSNVYRRELINDCGIRFISEREILNEDYLFVLQVSMAAQVVYISGRNFYCYDTREGSITMSYRQNMFERKKKLVDMYCKSLDTRNPDVQIRLKNFYIDCVYACIVNECSGNRSKSDSIKTIRQLLKDEKLQQCLADNRKLTNSMKTKWICFMMRHCMSVSMYMGYQLMKYMKNRVDA